MQSPAVNVMVKAARLGGNVLLRSINKLDSLNVVQKQRMDYASEVDADAEKAIVKTKSDAMANVHGIASDAASAIVEQLIGNKPDQKAVNDAVEQALKS